MTAVAGELTSKGFFRSLYDFRFTSFIATRWLKFGYALGVVLETIFAVLGLIASVAALSRSPLAGLLGLVFVAVFYVISLLWLRFVTEFLIVFFRMGDDVRAIRLGAGGAPGLLNAQTSRSVANELSSTDALATTGQRSAATSNTGVTAGASQAPPGWYGAPNDPTQDRYWDGSVWTEHFRPRGDRS